MDPVASRDHVSDFLVNLEFDVTDGATGEGCAASVSTAFDGVSGLESGVHGVSRPDRYSLCLTEFKSP